MDVKSGWVWEHFCQSCRQWRKTPDLPFHKLRVWTCGGCLVPQNGGTAVGIAGGSKRATRAFQDQPLATQLSGTSRGGRPPLTDEQRAQRARDRKRRWRATK